ncbi:MAG: GAF domain-containing protein [Candidatus Rokubacteria bacterium]|nr:GAF domain-containing protein [Candidatus Rokubacteria bacterium]
MARFRWTIKRKLLALGAATLLPVLLFLAFWTRWQVRIHTEEAEAELALASTQAAAQVEQILEQIFGHLELLVRTPAVQRRQVREAEARFGHLIAQHPELENLIAVAADGLPFAGTVHVPTGITVSLADRPWFRQVMATHRPAVSGFVVGRFTGRPVAVVAVPLRAGKGPPTGALTATLSLGRLSLLFRALPLTGGMTVTVVDGEGQVLSHHPEAVGWIGKRLPFAAALPSRPVVKKLAWPEGGERIAAVTPVGDIGWRVVVGVPAAALQRRIWLEAWSIALPVLGVLALSSLVGLLIAGRVWRPLQALAEAVAQFPGGGRISVDVRSTDEAGQLAQAFNAMAERLAASHTTLNRKNEELTAVNAIARALTSSLDLKGVLGILAQRAAQAVGADRCAVSLRRGGHLVLTMGQFADGHTDPALWEKFKDIVGSYRVEKDAAHDEAMRTRRPVAIEDAARSPLVPRHWVQEFGCRSLLVVPLVCHDDVIGTLTLDRTDAPHAWSREQIDMATTIADQAAVAIENARLYAESEARRRSAEALSAIGRGLTESLELTVVTKRIVDSLRELLGTQTTSLYRLEPGSGDLRVMVVSGEAGPVGPDVVFPLSTGAVGLAVEVRGPVVSENVLTDPRLTFTPELRARVEASEFLAILAIPLLVKGKVIGALSLRDQEGRVFTAEEVRLAQAFADQAALALENARLYEEAQRSLADLRTAQEQLVRGATMRALGELASGAAHHLNNLMAIVLGRVRLLLSGGESAAHRRPLQIIERAAMDAAEVVRRLSRFSRTQPIEESQPVDLRELASEVVEMTRARWKDAAQAEGIRIDATLEGQEVPPVMANPTALREVLINLVLNAVDALPAGGRIVLRTFREDRWAGLAVSDTGSGMSAEVKERALEPFFTTKGPKSRGLGLSMSYGILQRHGGTLDIESQPGRGTTVTISLPISTAAPAVAPQRPTQPPSVSPRRILVIDDDADVRETTVDLLATEGHRVSQAASGAEGVSMFRAQRHDVVFTDLGMPGMTGWEVAEAIKALDPTTRIVLLTGWADEIGQAAHQRGCVDQIAAKPLDLAAVAQLVATAPVREPG